MDFDYGAYCARFDLTTAEGARDLLQAALSDWRDDAITDEQFDDLVARTVSSLTNGE
jgi:hypothetical protein